MGPDHSGRIRRMPVHTPHRYQSKVETLAPVFFVWTSSAAGHRWRCGSLLVVDGDPLRADRASLIKIFELIGIKHLDTARAVESVDLRVTCWASGLSESPFDTAGFGPRLHNAASKLGVIVATQGVGLSVPFRITRRTRSPVRLKLNRPRFCGDCLV